ncbi:Transcription factor TFIIIB component B'' [Merluccius polli]|uniref:Transcription factor TFIIIB component B n=1 Tax=Merluccius polli TaxID=89951 RepID=A0AA47MBH8_MERPO|nr:Transcription factor TFIIIB component B'' [Merluccius polli]
MPASDTVTKPAKPPRARDVKLQRCGKQGKAAEPVTNSQDAPLATNSKDAPDTVETHVSDALSTEQVDEEESPLTQAKKRKLEYDDDDDDDDHNDNSSQDEDEVSTVKINLKPTRYGRMPKATQHLTYPTKEDSSSPRRPPTTSTPRPKSSKKPRLVTLRASQSDCSDDEEEEGGWKKPERAGVVEEEEEEENPPHASDPTKDSCAPVFVPASLRSPQPVVSVVEETMEELDILVNVPDVLDLSQDISHHAACEHAQEETDTVPFEHSLDLLADVINFLSPEHVEVSDNEAAHTLLTIGNRSLQSLLAHIEDPSAPNYATEEDVDPNCDIQSPFLPPVTALSDAPTCMGDATHLHSSATHNDPGTLTEDEPIRDTPAKSISSNKLPAALSTEPEPSQRESTEETTVVVAASSPQSKCGQLPKVKPRPNLLRSSRVARPTQKPVTKAPKPDGNQMLEAMHKEDASEEAPSPPAAEGTSSVGPMDCAPQSFSPPLPTSGGEIREETPARQEETAGRGQSLELEPQSETSVKSDFQDETSANMTLETGPEVATGSESGTDSTPSRSSVKISAEGKLSDSPAKVTEVVPPCLTSTRRRPFPKVKPNLGRQGSAAPSVESSDLAKASPDGSASSSQPQFTEDMVTQSESESTDGATNDTKTSSPNSSSSVLLTEMGSTLTPPGTGISREERRAVGVESPGRSQSQLQPTKGNLSDIGSSVAHSEQQPFVHHRPHSELGTQSKNDQHVVTSPLQILKKTSQPLGSETSGCTGLQRACEDSKQETSSPGTPGMSVSSIVSTTPVPLPPQSDKQSSAVEGGPAGGAGADRPAAGSKDSVSNVSLSQTEEETTRTNPQSTATTQRRRFSKVKPKPNLGNQASRVGHAKQLPTGRQVTQSNPDTGSDTLREALPLSLQSGGDVSDEHIRPLRSSSVSVQLSSVAASETELLTNPSKNPSCMVSQTSSIVSQPFETSESPEPPRAPEATLTGETIGEGMTSGQGASWLIENPFIALDSSVDEVFPSAAVPTALPFGQAKSQAFTLDQAPPAEPLSPHATETATPSPQTG